MRRVRVVEVLRERLIVDVSDVDWSRHPGWSRDFEASRMVCRGDPPAWAGEVVGVQREYLTEDDETVIRVDPPNSRPRDRL